MFATLIKEERAYESQIHTQRAKKHCMNSGECMSRMLGESSRSSQTKYSTKSYGAYDFVFECVALVASQQNDTAEEWMATW